MNEIQDRIFLIVKTKDLTSAEFAETIGVQPSNISHIMSGRNKPSLDLVMKILKRFPELRSDWLLNGQGSMNKEYNLFGADEVEKSDTKPVKLSQQKLEFDQITENPEVIQPPVESTEIKTEKIIEEYAQKEDDIIKERLDMEQHERKNKNPHKISAMKIEKIVIFYEGRTFREYSPED
jgi:transcriptional regulator with XRE-family HTH domain